MAVEDGVVRLTGVVGSALERSRAIANGFVNGVARVEADGLTVRWWNRDAMTASKRAPAGAATLARTIEERWRREPYLEDAEAKVRIDPGRTAVLFGNVKSLAAKRQAEWLATTTVGVARVRNHLKVRPKPPVSDEQLATAVRQALRRDPLVDSQQVWVSVREGVVRVLGTATSPLEKQRAGELAAGIESAVDVHNLIVVADDGQSARARARDLREQILTSTPRAQAR